MSMVCPVLFRPGQLHNRVPAARIAGKKVCHRIPDNGVDGVDRSRSVDAVYGNKVPDILPTYSCRWKTITQQGRKEDHGPLHTLRLMNRHDADGVRAGVLIVLPAFRV